MENQNYSQLELFSSNSTSSLPQKNNSVLKLLRAYEKTIFLIIAFSLTAIASFTLGVEKGKKISALRSAATFDLAALKPKEEVIAPTVLINKQEYTTTSQTLKNTPIVNAALINQPPLIQSVSNKKIDLARSQGNQKYTIQIASYSSKSQAQKEMQALKKKGLNPIIISKGKYSIICLGSYTDKKNAESMLVQLKKRYQDCIIRRL